MKLAVGAAYKMLPRDENGYILYSNCLDIDTERMLAFSDKRLIATLGVHDLVIIETEDTMMDCSCERELDMENTIEELAAAKRAYW